MRSIQIDDEVLAALQEQAVPFSESLNSVLRRILELDSTGSQHGRSQLPPAAESTSEIDEDFSVVETRFFLRRGRVSGTAVRGNGNDLIVLTAFSPLDEHESMAENHHRERSRLLNDGVFTEEPDGRFRLVRPTTFTSPSLASSVLLGHPSNGLIEWKDSSGRPLRGR